MQPCKDDLHHNVGGGPLQSWGFTTITSHIGNTNQINHTISIQLQSTSDDTNVIDEYNKLDTSTDVALEHSIFELLKKYEPKQLIDIRRVILNKLVDDILPRLVLKKLK